MEISFSSRKLAEACNSERESVRRWGQENARKVRQRLAELAAAESLAVLFTLPQARCHPLHGDRQGQFAVDVRHPFRLIFEPADDPVPQKNDGGIDPTRVRAVRVLEVADYHGN